MLSRLPLVEWHSRPDLAARSADARRSKTPLPTSKDPTGGSPRFGARLRFHATPRTDQPHAAPRRAAPASRSDQQERYGLARAPMADVQLLLRTAVVDMFWIRPNLAFTQRKYK